MAKGDKATTNHGGSNGRPPEEMAMMSNKKRMETDLDFPHSDSENEDCGMAACRPSFLQRFSNLWTFTIFVGLSSLASEFLHSYLKTQIPMMKRQFQLKDKTATWMVYSSEVACLASVLFLSVFARRIHIPRALAITSLLCGFAGILCIVPFLATKDNLVAGPKVHQNDTYSLTKFLMLAPGCNGGPKSHGPKVTKPQPLVDKKSKPGSKDNVDSGHGKTILIPDFKKLATHPKYPQLLDAAKGMNIDLATLAQMDVNGQLRYLEKLPPNVREMLPQLKLFLGDNADDYFIHVKVPGESGKDMILIPDVQKLTTHPRYSLVVDLASILGVDLVAMTQMDLRDQVEYLDTIEPDMRAMIPKLKVFLGPDGDNYFIYVTPPPPKDDKSITLIDFKKLKTNPNYAMLVKMAQVLNVDLNALARMNLRGQLDYLDNLRPDRRKMLPKLKGFFGPNPDSYFIEVTPPPPPTTPAEDEKILDFKKLKTHPNYQTLIKIAQAFGVDLEALALKNRDEQIQYLDNLPSNAKDMLPRLKAFIGENADDYYVPIESTGEEKKEKWILIPDFKKLTSHPLYSTLVVMAKPMKINLETLATLDVADQLKYLERLPPESSGRLPQLKSLLGVNADAYFIYVKPPALAPLRTITIPDFKKLSTHSSFQTLVGLAKATGVDLEALAAMDLDGQLEYLDALPKSMQGNLPMLKSLLGDDADSYFITVKVPGPVDSSDLKPAADEESNSAEASTTETTPAIEASLEESPSVEEDSASVEEESPPVEEKSPAVEAKTMEIPDFKKLKTHPKYPMLVTTAKQMNIDLEAVGSMSLEEQAKYVVDLPKNIRSMLPQLKLLLGPNADSYFINVKDPSASPVKAKTMEIPDFKKLKTHPKYPMLVTTAKQMNIDLEAVGSMSLEEQAKYVVELPENIRNMLPQLKLLLGPNADSYFISVKDPSASSVEEKSIEIPDFKKLKSHPEYPKLATMAKQLNIDLEALAEMEVDAQLEYMETLPKHVIDMLPQLKTVLGPDADSYFIHVTIQAASSAHTEESEGPTCTSMSRSMFEGLYANICPFNTGPFLVNHSTAVLTVLNVGMALQGVARAPRMAFGVTYLNDNTQGPKTILHLAIMYGITFLGPLVSLIVGLVSTMFYITDADVGSMTFYNPRWLPRWWLGFVLFAVSAFICALPLLFFPKKLRKGSQENSSMFAKPWGIIQYFKDFFKSLCRLIINPLYISLMLGHLVSGFVWAGLGAIIIPYVTHQFSLAPQLPGMFVFLSFLLMGAIGIFIGGIVAYKFKLSPLGNLKFVLALAVGLVIVQICQLSFGCDQPNVDRGEKVLTNYTTQSCRCACQCIDHVYMPGCGSDGKMYYSPCHAGCTSKNDKEFTDCQCIDDDIQTLTPGHCSICEFFYPFAIVFSIGGFMAGMQFIPLLVATFKCVKPKDVPLAIGLRIMLFIAIVALPGPLVYQAIQDDQCLNKLPECGIVDPCVLSDIVPLRHKTFGLSLAMEFLAAIALFFSFFIGKKFPSYFAEGRYSED